ncbi:hypothetical protein GASC598B02_003590, partial [Gilliamella apicola SCGC AB-598-B02]
IISIILHLILIIILGYQAIRSSSGCITSPVPVIISEALSSATASNASNLRSILSVRQSLASSTAARALLDNTSLSAHDIVQKISINSG